MPNKDTNAKAQKAIFALTFMYGLIFLFLLAGIVIGILAALKGQWLFSFLAPFSAYGLVGFIKSFKTAKSKILETQAASRAARKKLPETFRELDEAK